MKLILAEQSSLTKPMNFWRQRKLGNQQRIYFKNKKFESNYKKMKKAIPAGEVAITNITEDETIWMIVVSSDVDPGSRYLYNTTTGKAEFLYKARPSLPIEHLATMKPIRIKARDGMIIPSYLTIPKGTEPKNPPAVKWIRDGPWGLDVWGYNSTVQFLANRGYGVLQPYFRPSTGYGKNNLMRGPNNGKRKMTIAE